MMLRTTSLVAFGVFDHMSLTPWLRLVCLFCFRSHNVVLAEDQDAAADALDDDVSSQSTSSSDEFYMVLAFSLIFAFVITLIGAGIGYFSFMEDNLMRRYRSSGEVIRAEVASTEFARSGGQVGLVCGNKTRSSPEYVVFVEYNHRESKFDIVRVRKQVKAKASDFSNVACPNTVNVPSGSGSSTDYEPNVCFNLCCCLVIEDEGGKLEPGRSEDSSIHSGTHELELYFLPAYPRSGLPKRQVERKCSLVYRFSTFALILFCVALALFCTVFAVNSIADVESYRQHFLGKYGIAVFLALIVLEIPVIHFSMGHWFADALREEYLESGQFVPTKELGDNSSMSSGSDTFLRVSRGQSSRTSQEDQETSVPLIEIP